MPVQQVQASRFQVHISYFLQKCKKGKSPIKDLPLLKNDITTIIRSQKPVVNSRYSRVKETLRLLTISNNKRNVPLLAQPCQSGEWHGYKPLIFLPPLSFLVLYIQTNLLWLFHENNLLHQLISWQLFFLPQQFLPLHLPLSDV